MKELTKTLLHQYIHELHIIQSNFARVREVLANEEDKQIKELMVRMQTYNEE